MPSSIFHMGHIISRTMKKVSHKEYKNYLDSPNKYEEISNINLKTLYPLFSEKTKDTLKN